MEQQYKHTAKKLGEILVESGLITKEQLEKGLAEQKKTGKKLGEVLVESGLLTEADIAKTLSMQLGIPYIDLSTAVIEPEAIEMIPEKLAQRHLILPISTDRKVFTIAMADPLNFEALSDVRFATGKNVRPTITTPTEIQYAIERYYHLSDTLHEVIDRMTDGFVEVVPEKDEGPENVEEIVRKGKAPPIIRMVNSIIFNAVKNRASDIHIEPQEKRVLVRERIDGLLRESLQLPKWVQGAITSRIKIMARMDIAEKRIPQDGRIKIRVEGREIDIRISTLPIQYGEDIVMRILDASTAVFKLDELGLMQGDYRRIVNIIERPQGTVLVTGPTGSGKSSTLYAMINHIKTDVINIITLEDPIEYELAGVNQVAINEKTGLTFAYGLRSVLRQDPDVIMVGEMRDAETANIAFQASLTGHLVLSTLHTNTAVSSVTRLVNLDIQPYLIASSLNGIVAQRLVRRLCNQCKEPYSPSREEIMKIGLNDVDLKKAAFFRAVGCDACDKTGYKGRVGIFEVLVCNQAVKELISGGATEDAILNAAREGGMRLMAEDGIAKVKEGITSMDELVRVLYVKGEQDVLICSRCNNSVRSDFITCPYCGYAIVDRCPSCGKQRETDWRYCPYCRKEFEGLQEKVAAG